MPRKSRSLDRDSEPNLEPENDFVEEETESAGSEAAADDIQDEIGEEAECTTLINVGNDGASADGLIDKIENPVTITVPAKSVEAISLKLPLIPLAEHEKHGYVGTHFEIRLTQRQARTLKAVYYGLHELHAKMSNGRHVDKSADVIRFILDNIADSFEENEV